MCEREGERRWLQPLRTFDELVSLWPVGQPFLQAVRRPLALQLELLGLEGPGRFGVSLGRSHVVAVLFGTEFTLRRGLTRERRAPRGIRAPPAWKMIKWQGGPDSRSGIGIKQDVPVLQVLHLWPVL